ESQTASEATPTAPDVQTTAPTVTQAPSVVPAPTPQPAAPVAAPAAPVVAPSIPASNPTPPVSSPATPPAPADPPVTDDASPYEGVYTFEGSPPGLIVDAAGNFWQVTRLTCAQYESGVLSSGLAQNLHYDNGDCNSASLIGPQSATMSVALDSGLLTVSIAYVDLARDPSNPRGSYLPENESKVLAWSQAVSSAPKMADLAGTWLLPSGQGSITVASDGSFTFQNCAWQASIDDTAVDVYTLRSSCGVGVVTVYQGQLFGGVTLDGALYDLGTLVSGLYP